MRKIVLIPAVLLCTATFAHDGVKDPQVLARMDLMKDVAADMKVLGEMTKGDTDYDMTAAQAAATRLKAHAGQIPAMFKDAASDPRSEAARSIWDDFADFEQEAQAMYLAAEVLETSSKGTLGADFAAMAKTCGSCHKSYRIED